MWYYRTIYNKEDCYYIKNCKICVTDKRISEDFDLPVEIWENDVCISVNK